MARTIEQIKAQLIAEKNAQIELSGLNSPSQAALWNLIFYVVAVCLRIQEVIIETYKTEIESELVKSAPATPPYIQSKMFEFQYKAGGDPNYNVVQINPDFSVSYPVVDSTYQIITQCSVTSDFNKNLVIKVAVSDPPVAMGSTPLLQANSYVAQVLPAGLYASVISLDADKLYIEADVYYNGLYSNIQSAVETSLSNYLASFKGTKFDGIIRVSEIESAIVSVAGVNDVVIKTIKARADATSFGSATVIYDLITGTNLRIWNTVAGYVAEETTSGQTFSDTITYIPQS